MCHKPRARPMRRESNPCAVGKVINKKVPLYYYYLVFGTWKRVAELLLTAYCRGVYNAGMENQEKMDDELKAVCQKRTAARLEAMADFLERVALDPTFTDKRLTRDRLGPKVVDVPIPINVRVASAKIWKEIFADKAVGDVKEKAKEKKDRTLDMRKVLDELGEEMKKTPQKISEEEVDL